MLLWWVINSDTWGASHPKKKKEEEDTIKLN